MTRAVDNLITLKNIGYLNKHEGYFYHAKLICRKKDTEVLHVNEKFRMIRSYFFEDYDEISFRYDDIKRKCDDNNARLYINLTPKSYHRVCIESAKYILDRTIDKNYQSLHRVLDKKAANDTGLKGRRVWIIDVDMESDGYNIDVFKTIAPYVMGKIDSIDTPNGFHMLVEPTNKVHLENGLRMVRSMNICKEIDLHINAPTVVYSGEPVK